MSNSYTIKELKKLTRRELLGVWLHAQENQDKWLEDITYQIMIDTQKIFSIKGRIEK